MSRQWQTLEQPAQLAGLYARAALKRKVSGEQLPSLALRCWLRPDPEKLAAYRKVCGYGAGNLLPATYPHVLAFAMQLQLLTDKSFPFPLRGLLHLRNIIRIQRPLGGISGVQVSVHVANLTPHEKGTLFDLITQVQDPLGPLWEETSTLLCHDVHIAGQPVVSNPPVTGELPMSEIARWAALSDCGRQYAKVSGDYNPIHLSAASARMFGFPQAIAHGMWTKARALAALREHVPVANVEIAVQFEQPLQLPSDVGLHASAAGASGRFSVEGQDDRVHLVGQWRPLH
ncbi:MaoC/PaaZ C-terminal domain-containing protein [Pseudomonas sp. dw_358]|uniref:MaoC family dehydratase n=1 Tax=Pseudomonas sp. dw_358 TaxID=2720083 RepID=UPI001BD1DE9B|nr:MaoC/PaaZ C-terminal domain-containing protein [Pseudomonas sp. dw_358]